MKHNQALVSNSAQRIFVTGTDTHAGKTFVTVKLAEFFRTRGQSVALFKPIASGCSTEGDPLSNEDIYAFHTFDDCVPVQHLNIWAFGPAIAPHIAAQSAKISINLEIFSKRFHELYEARVSASRFDIALVEGAGGWCLPLNDKETLDQWVAAQAMNVVLVVGMKLGCLNHALLTAKAIHASGARLVGWISNAPDYMPYLQENLDTLEALMPVPWLAHLGPFEKNLIPKRIEDVFPIGG